MIEIRWHGRGGQGAKTAAQFLAEASLDTGKYIQAFPEYGPERAGAPIRTYDRISTEPINLHCAVTSPGYVVVIDPTLLSPKVVEGLSDKGILLVNTSESVDSVRQSPVLYSSALPALSITPPIGISFQPFSLILF